MFRMQVKAGAIVDSSTLLKPQIEIGNTATTITMYDGFTEEMELATGEYEEAGYIQFDMGALRETKYIYTIPSINKDVYFYKDMQYELETLRNAIISLGGNV